MSAKIYDFQKPRTVSLAPVTLEDLDFALVTGDAPIAMTFGGGDAGICMTRETALALSRYLRGLVELVDE